MIDEIQKRLEVVEVRNRNKDLDKAWERSWSRKLFIVAMTYLFASLYLYLIGAQTPFINAVVPAAGFMLSHLSLKQIEELWLKHVKKARR
jgi:amino acid transporter